MMCVCLKRYCARNCLFPLPLKSSCVPGPSRQGLPPPSLCNSGLDLYHRQRSSSLPEARSAMLPVFLDDPCRCCPPYWSNRGSSSSISSVCCRETKPMVLFLCRFYYQSPFFEQHTHPLLRVGKSESHPLLSRYRSPAVLWSRSRNLFPRQSDCLQYYMCQ